VEVARQIGRTPAQVALNWVATQPGITSTIIGATKIAQLDDNLASLDFAIPAESRKRLDEVSALEPAHPYIFFSDALQSMMAGGTTVRPWTPARATGAPAIPAAAAKASAAEK
jgi:hypothetical protein